MSSNRLKRLRALMTLAQKNEYYATIGKYQNRYGTPTDAVKLHIMEHIRVGRNPLEGLEKHG